ncbi:MULTISPECIES: hypothetical protein [Stenotrophomonas maltophilia group]|uniref:hypothetical protein n=1 Tax=Stenotrophomonas maltophilia group TaxID=995085 RepID=UPI00051924E2|nr:MULTISPECIES: hypothetical protein [Stenotrophomonas maltophilia group]EKU9961527.1 hypothetical protein [Stenotrophomonas maltophilia]EKU9987780.1 hypothetical protein [Stenotrophomonas maltophilia]MDT3558193.1 hypothetical protein [Stenotrophomonas maltophilia group sp. msm1]
MTNRSLLVALTKRALAKQLMRAGSPKKEAEAAASRLPHRLQWAKLPQHVQSEIAWKAATSRKTQR